MVANGHELSVWYADGGIVEPPTEAATKANPAKAGDAKPRGYGAARTTRETSRQSGRQTATGRFGGISMRTFRC